MSCLLTDSYQSFIPSFPQVWGQRKHMFDATDTAAACRYTSSLQSHKLPFARIMRLCGTRQPMLGPVGPDFMRLQTRRHLGECGPGRYRLLILRTSYCVTYSSHAHAIIGRNVATCLEGAILGLFCL